VGHKYSDPGPPLAREPRVAHRWLNLYSICSTPELSKKNFCNGLEMKFASTLG